MSIFLAPVSADPSPHIIPNDIVETVLRASPDFGTLYSAIGVSKTWHRVFQTHPKSVVLSVAQNSVGPALSQAVRFIRYPYPEKTPNHWGADEEQDADEEDEDSDPTEDDTEDEDEDGGASKKRPLKSAPKSPRKDLPAPSESDDIGELSLQERAQLEKNAKIVTKLGALFSLRHKDRTSRTSQLTAIESHRFARAMYRIMLYCELFYLPLNLDDIDSMEDEPEELETIQKARHALLNEYPTPELLELRAVVAFLHELIGEVVDQEDYDRLKDICLSTGPAVILEAYVSKQPDVFEEALEHEVMTSGEDNILFGGFFSTPLDKIWTERVVAAPVDEWGAILDEVRGQSDACAQCGVVAGLGLWSEANWVNLINVDFCAHLLGNLNKNDIETEALVGLFMSSTCGADVVVSEIYDMKTAEFSAWKKDESLCSVCLDKLIGAHLHLWLFKRKVQDGWTPTGNCWYGYNCRTQVHKREHAKTKNHLCAPTR
ncbi:hypothetical protein B0H11DRAFT_2042835 [Mycena galericulata]|nr:hypothetical protein B0H11DRAFT_2042835 [Mycena galericulata]